MTQPSKPVGRPLGPWEVLGVASGASEEQIRAAYLEKVRLHPPDRSPEEFERIRDAYEQLRDARSRALLLLEADPSEPLVSQLERAGAERRHARWSLWLAAIEES